MCRICVGAYVEFVQVCMKCICVGDVCKVCYLCSCVGVGVLSLCGSVVDVCECGVVRC